MDYEQTERETARVRFNLWGFLTDPQRATWLWNRMMQNGEPLWVPPEACDVQQSDLAAWLAREQAERVSRARLYFLEPSAGDLAIQGGSLMRTGEIMPDPRPPVPYGLLLCPNGIGYSADGMQIIATCWSPCADGYWVSWWADSRELFTWMISEGSSVEDLPRLARTFGDLHYISAGLLSGEEGESAEVAAREGRFLNIHADPHADYPNVVEPPDLVGNASTTLGAWYLLRHNLIDLDRLTPSSDEIELDRRMGLVPSKITRGYLANADDADQLWRSDNG